MTIPFRYFLDTEFIDDGLTIDLISIALVTESDTRELYLCNSDVELEHAGQWVKHNVIPLLPSGDSQLWQPRRAIAEAVRAFILPDPEPQVWAYFAAYDWVALCQLFGPMVSLPVWFPKHVNDVRQLKDLMGPPEHSPTRNLDPHNALADARWTRDLFRSFVGPKNPSLISGGVA